MQWRNALVTEWLNSFNQGSKPTSLYIAGAHHWSTVMAMMLPHGQLSEPMLALLMSALAHHEVASKMDNFIWHPEKLDDTLVVLQLAEQQCPSHYNLAKAAKLLDTPQDGGDNSADRPARQESTAVMKVLQTLGPETSAATLDMLEVLRALEQPERSEHDFFSLEQAEQLARPRPIPAQVVVSVKLIEGELRLMQWYGTLRDVHERANVSQETFNHRMKSKLCTMCGSAAHFFHACPQAQPYSAAFTAAARAGGQQGIDQAVRTKEQRYFDSALRRTPDPRQRDHDEHDRRAPSQEQTPGQRARDTHIRAAADGQYRDRGRWLSTGVAAQAKRAERNQQTRATFRPHFPRRVECRCRPFLRV